MKHPLLAGLLALLLLLPSIDAAPVVRPVGRPVIESIRGRSVRIRVPSGLHSVTLERCTDARLNRWEVVATRTTGQKAGVVDFQVTQPVSRRFLRVKGIAAAVLPDSIAGARIFLADPAQAGVGLLSPGLMMASAQASVSATTASDSQPRLVAESDIWRVAGDRLYFFNELRGLQVFDISNPDDPALLGQMRAPGAGEEMYLLDTPHVVLLTRGSNFVRLPILALSSASIAPASSNSGAAVIVDVQNGRPQEVARVAYSGALRESRRVGNVLYVVSEIWNGSAGELEVTAIDLANPAAPVKRDSLRVPGWGAVVHATDRYLFVVSSTDWDRSQVDVIDITSPIGVLRKRGRIDAAGRVPDKFKMNLAGDVLTIVSEVPRRAVIGQPSTPDDPVIRTRVETFSLAQPDLPARLGSLDVGHGESLFATRFDDDRLYIVTFFQVDPLWVVDLSQPAALRVLGELKVPGFSRYIEPLGDRLVTVGRLGSQTAVSLFDVADPTQPRTLAQLPLGDGFSWSEAEITEKAFNVMPEENLIVVPYSGYDPTTGYANRLQLIDLNQNTLQKRGVIEHRLAARRTAVQGSRLLAISSTDLVTVNLENRDRPSVTSEVEIAWRVDRVLLAGSYLLQVGGSADFRSAATQTLSVSTPRAPEAILATVNLDAVPVVGLTMQNGRLYVAQASSRTFNPLVYKPAADATPTPAPSFILSVFDLTSLPALPRLARVEADVDLGWVNSLTAVWPKPDLLVWIRQGGAFFGPPIYLPGPIAFSSAVTVDALPTAAASPRTTTVSAVRRGAPIPWATRGGVEALVFNVSDPAAPVLAGQLNIRGSSSAEWSAPFAADGKVFVSAMGTDDFVKIGEGQPAASSVPSRRFRHFLRVVDFANFTQPVVGPEINIPGRLIGLGGSGARLYTEGCRYQPDAMPMFERALHVSGFDGTAATFIDQLPLAAGSPSAIDEETLLIGVRGSDDRVEAWRLGSDSRLVRTGDLTVADASALKIVRGVLIAGEDFGPREACDVTIPTALRRLGPMAPRVGWSWLDPANADGSPTRGVWEPLGAYGVEVTVFEP